MGEVVDKKDVVLMKQCIDDAKLIVFEKRLLESQSSVVSIAVALFESRSRGK
ncbi:hypothetical protein KO361_00090 [Candidatus Woesearchaeota archaeon]|nr:hypothetical protein [Candidatus Woesearchaeota archaeon]